MIHITLSYLKNRAPAWLRSGRLAMVCALSACATPTGVAPPPQAIPSPPLTTTPPATPPKTPEPHAAYQASPFEHAPNIADTDWVGAWPAWLASCTVLAKPSAPTPNPWATVCAQARALHPVTAKAIRHYFQTQFTLWRIQPPGESASGKLTGYYEPELVGSRTRTPGFTVPLARPPADLLNLDRANGTRASSTTRLRGRWARDPASGQNRVLPYWTRAQLTANGHLDRLALLWVEDPIEAFFLQVQGSGRIRLVGGRDHGKIVRLGYADTNGHPYHSIGRWLVENGELDLSEASMQGIKAWARKHPHRVTQLLNINPSYIFFKEHAPADPNAGPVGAQNVPLTAGYSAAVDPRYTPLGAPMLITSTHPSSRAPLNRLLIAQDTGSAIQGPARVDLFWGSGSKAGELAGRSNDPVAVWVLLPPPLTPTL